MKKLEISPAPWKKYEIKDTVCVNDCNGRIVHTTGIGFEHSIENACLIAAAPELYECLCDACNRKCEMCDIRESDGSCNQPESDCIVKKWRKALAKAAGESEVK